MTISIWIIFILIAGVGFWFYYKKNRFRLKETPVKSTKRQTNYTLTNIDQMLNHVTQKEGIEDSAALNADIDILEENQNEEQVSESEQKKNAEFDIKSGIIASIILKKKDGI